jgi:hypothetical protein
VGTAKVEDVGNTSGDAVGQFAGHRVLCNFREELPHAIAEFTRNVAANIFWQ